MLIISLVKTIDDVSFKAGRTVQYVVLNRVSDMVTYMVQFCDLLLDRSNFFD